MRKRSGFFILMILLIVILFLVLYAIGLVNLLFTESAFFEEYRWIDFQSRLFAVIYLIVLSIFFIVVMAILIRIVISMKQESAQLTSTNVDEFIISPMETNEMDSTYEQLSFSLNRNIGAIEEYGQTIDDELRRMKRMEDEINVGEILDSLYQNFSQMVSDLSEAGTVGELFEKILFWGSSFSNSRRGSIMVVDKSQELYIYKTIGWSSKEKEDAGNKRIPLGEGIAGKVASERKRIFVTNLENYEGFEFKYKDHYQTNSFISLPIMGIKKVVAVLNLTENKNGHYSMNDLEMLNIITQLSSRLFELIQIKKRL
jgi:hypothetical protein